VSIIMGLSIAVVLRGAVNPLRADSPTTPGYVHGLWVVAVLLQNIGLWSLRWSGEQREVWPFHILVAFLFLPILYYAQAELLFPRADREVNLTDYLIENRRPFFALVILGMLAAGVGPYLFYEGVDPLRGGDQLVSLVTSVVAAILFVPPLISKNVRVHAIWAALYLALLLVSFSGLSIG
jgi:hypothetical protein